MKRRPFKNVIIKFTRLFIIDNNICYCHHHLGHEMLRLLLFRRRHYRLRLKIVILLKSSWSIISYSSHVLWFQWSFVPRGMNHSDQDYHLAYWDRNKKAAIFQTTFSNAFSWMKIYEFRLRFHWSLFLRARLIISQHWFRWWLGAVHGTSHCLKQCWLVYWRIGVEWRIYIQLHST